LQGFSHVIDAAVVAPGQQIPQAGTHRRCAQGRPVQQQFLELLQQPRKRHFGGCQTNDFGLQVANERQQAIDHPWFGLKFLQKYWERLQSTRRKKKERIHVREIA